MTLDTGVSGYVHARASVDVYFPIDRKGNAVVCCTQCDQYVSSTRRCGLTHKVCEFPEKYVSGYCPLEIVEEDTNE